MNYKYKTQHVQCTHLDVQGCMYSSRTLLINMLYKRALQKRGLITKRKRTVLNFVKRTLHIFVHAHARTVHNPATMKYTYEF